MRKRIQKKDILFGIAILLLGIVLIYSTFRVLMPSMFSDDSDDIASKTIERDGVKYFPRQDIKVFMLMGIDKEGPVEDSGSYNNDGESDVVVLAIFDETAKTYSVLCINRDTMLEMPILGIGGKNAGTATAQLALSHTYGSGLKDSCENTRTAVSNFLYGIDIHYYLSLNMDAISILTDTLGGVKVNVTDDFSSVDDTITKGEMVLNGDQALTFVRARHDLGDQLNTSRMVRQEEFMKGFLAALSAKLDKSDSFVLTAYDAISDYMVTDCSYDTLSSLISRYADYELTEIVSPEGESVAGEEYMEFHADKEALDELILRLFYAPKGQ